MNDPAILIETPFSSADINTAFAGCVFLDGRAGGQTIYGGTESGDDLTLSSNPSGDGRIYFGSGGLSINEAIPRLYFDGSSSISPHVGGQGLTFRQDTVGRQMLFSLFRTDAAAGTLIVGTVRGEAVSSTGNSYDAGGMVIRQIVNTDGAEKSRVSFQTCQGAANPTELMRLDENGHLQLVNRATENLIVKDAGSSGGTEKGWIEVALSTGGTGYIRVYAAK